VAPGLVRLAGAAAIALLAAALVPPLGLGNPRTEHASVALVLIGIAIVVARRPAFMQVLGLIVAETGPRPAEVGRAAARRRGFLQRLRARARTRDEPGL